MKKAITILILMAILCSSLSSCRKKNVGLKPNETKVEDSIGPNDGKAKSAPVIEKADKEKSQTSSNVHAQNILFTARFSESLLLNKKNITTGKNEKIKTLNMIPMIIEISPNGKKVSFLVQTQRKNFKSDRIDSVYDLYVMNIDGSDIKRITYQMNLRPFGEASDFRFLFSPDNQEIIVFSSYWIDYNDPLIYIVNSSKDICTKYDFNHTLYKPIKSYIDQYVKKTLCYRPNQDSYLVWNRQEIGSFSWKTKTFKKICDSPIPNSIVDSVSWSPDFNKIIFKVIDPDETESSQRNKHIFVFNEKTKEKVKVASLIYQWVGEEQDYEMMNKGQSVVYLSQNSLNLFDLNSKKTTEIKSFQSTCYLFSIDDFNLVIKVYADKKIFFYLFNSTKNSIEELMISETSNAFSFIDKNLLFLTNKGLMKYNFQKKTYHYLKEIDDARDGMFVSAYNKFYITSDRSYPYCNLFVLDLNGNQIGDVEENILLYKPIYNLDNEIFFFSAQPESSDLFYSSPLKDEPENLTKGLYHIIRSEVSPDKQKVAFYSYDDVKKVGSFNLIDLSKRNQIKPIVTFPFDMKGKRFSIRDHVGLYDIPKGLYPDDYFLTISWTKDSQYLYFVTQDIKSKFFIHKVKSDGTEIKLLSSNSISSMSPDVSPDGKQIVYVTGEERKIAIMNADGSEKNIVSDSITKLKCNFPSWSPDGKMITFSQIIKEDRFIHKEETTNQILIILPDGKLIKKLDCQYVYPNTTFFEYIQTKNFWSITMKYFSYLKAINNAGMGEGCDKNKFIVNLVTNFSIEDSLKPIIHKFLWSEVNDTIMLFVSSFNNGYSSDILVDHELVVFDCEAKRYLTISQDIFQIFDATWSLDGKEILYSGTDSKTGQIIFKTSQPDGSNQKVLFTFGENPLKRPISIEKIEKLVWLK